MRVDKYSFVQTDTIFLMGLARYAQNPKIASLQYLSNISRKRSGINMIFCMKVIIKIFYKLTPTFLVTIVRYAQSTQNNNFATYLQYLKKKGRDEVFFCMCHWNDLHISIKDYYR